MRLTSTETALLLKIILQFSSPDCPQVFLYGSRTQDDLKGGDIDLLVVFNDHTSLDQFNSKIAYCLASIKSSAEIGDQKIDLKAIHRSKASEPFAAHILKSAIQIKN